MQNCNNTRDRQQRLLEGLKEIISIFWGPTPERCTDLLVGSFFDICEKLDVQEGLGIAETLKAARMLLVPFSEDESLYHHLDEAYVRLFINDRNGIAAPLYESCYSIPDPEETAALMGEAAVRMKKRFESKGLALSNDIHEPPDHLAVELEYLYFLLEKGWNDGIHDLIDEASAFAAETLLPWLSRFQNRLSKESEAHFYANITSILISILGFIAGFKAAEGS